MPAEYDHTSSISEKTSALARAEEACRACKGCSLSSTRTQTVFGCGPADARLMFVGEAPGEREDAMGIPFVGAAGQLFNQFLAVAGIERDEVYIANILKCRPPRNRDPLPEEAEVCMGHLRTQVKIIRPAIIVCLGRIAACQLIHPEFRITREHGVWHERGRFSMMAVYHPSALLRDVSKREDMMADMDRIAERYRSL